MAPQFFEVDVWYGQRKLDDQTFRVAVDWDPATAEHVARALDGHILATHHSVRAVAPDLRLYTLRAFEVDRDGRRGNQQVWVWRLTTDPTGGALWKR